VLRFARDHRCRQHQILRYLGQADAAACGHCDNCLPSAGNTRWGTPRELSGGALEAVRIVLSGVARVSQRRVGCGKQLLAKMLCGSTDKAVERNRMQKLSTFGLLKHLKQAEVLQLIDALLLCGLLEQNEIERFRPVLQLTTRGADVMSGRDGHALNLPLPDDLWRKLDDHAPRLPRERSAPARDTPPATSIDSKAPSTPTPATAAATEHENRVDRPAPSQSAPHEATSGQPSHYWTWRLLQAGFTPTECAAARSLSEDVVLDHALRAADSGWQIDARWFLAPELIARIDQVVGAAEPSRIRPLLAKLPRGTRYEDVQLVIKSRHS
jgi:ATP-dependent DNA helicase RecQ